MAMINQQIVNAFSPRSLAGLQGFDTGGCGCGSLGCGCGLAGLDGWWDDLTAWFGTPQAPGIDCEDSGNWRIRDYGDGVCANECGNNSDRVDCPGADATPTGQTNPCADENNWKSYKYNDGTCALICGTGIAPVPCEYTSYGGAKTLPPPAAKEKIRLALVGAAKPAPDTVSGNICDDTGLWAIEKGIDGKCWNYCTADRTQQGQIDASYCAIGKPMTGKKITGPASLNWMLIGGIGLAMMFAMRD